MTSSREVCKRFLATRQAAWSHTTIQVKAVLLLSKCVIGEKYIMYSNIFCEQAHSLLQPGMCSFLFNIYFKLTLHPGYMLNVFVVEAVLVGVKYVSDFLNKAMA